MTDDNCIFCKIAAGEVPSYTVHESDRFVAFLDISQLSEGHTLCIPKDQVKVIWDSPDIGSYFEFVKKVGDHFLRCGFKFVDTLTMGREVPHAHVHLVPHNGDGKDWEEALAKIIENQEDPDRRISEGDAKKVLERLQF